MISRRLLRIKTLQIVYAFNRKEGDDLVSAEKELETCIGRSYDLYLYLMLLLAELRLVAREKIETALNKKMPNWEDLNPNRKFADNQIIELIDSSRVLAQAAAARKVTWQGSAEIPRVLFGKIAGWNEYNEYLVSADTTQAADKKFILNLLAGFLFSSDDFLNHLEEKSIYWNDDLEFALMMIDKTFRKIKPGSGIEFDLIPLYKNDDDERFPFHLLRQTLLKNELTRELIDRNTTNWEIERIALMDILVMQLAITEIMVFPEIPVKVTFNEYIEIAKQYCTSKSSTFINGILDKVVKEMKEKNLFEKSGRGLVGDLTENDNI